MQVSSASTPSPASIPLSLQSTRPHSNVERRVAAVARRTEPQEYFVPSAPPYEPRIDLDDKTEKKLSRIKEVQVAFKAALNITPLIEEQYLLDPIV